jgi:SRSO17 transposase
MPNSSFSSQASEQRFVAYLARLTPALGHADRAEPFRAYCQGLLLPGDRKSVEPMAARLDPSHVRSRHQSMHHFVADAPWSDDQMLASVRDYALPTLLQSGGVLYWIVDDTGLPKKGRHSVGVARQYCGQLGKPDNCQVAVSLSVAHEEASLPLAYRLYLPEEWALDEQRCQQAGVPPQLGFQTKPQIALSQIEAALEAGVPPGVVLADAAFGNDTTFREHLSELGLVYAVAIQPTTAVWPPGAGPLPPAPYGGRGRPPTLLRRDETHQPVSVKALALSLAARSYRRVTWRQGAKGRLASRFAAVRVIVAHRDYWRSVPRQPQWLLIEWPPQEAEPTRYWLSTLPPKTSLKKLVRVSKGRWRIERDYEELKQELGLGHYEGRGWRGFHHHATLVIAAYAFLMVEHGLFPP